MKTVKVNPLSKAFTNNIQEGFKEGYTVVCAQRPINGVVTWVQERALGNGIYFAYGSLEQYQEHWTFLDASTVNIQTNNDVMELIKQECINEEVTLEEVLEDSSIEDLAESLGLIYIQAEEDTTSEQWKTVSQIKKATIEETSSVKSDKVNYNSSNTDSKEIEYYYYRHTFKTYLEALTYVLKNRGYEHMIVPSNHPTMTGERVQQLESEYIHKGIKMAHEDVKEYYDYISSSNESSDQLERYYKLKTYMQQHEWKIKQKEDEKKRMIEAMEETRVIFNAMKDKGIIRKPLGSSEGFYYNGELVYMWSGGISSVKLNNQLKAVYKQCFNKNDLAI